jgi:hypothetical protein
VNGTRARRQTRRLVSFARLLRFLCAAVISMPSVVATPTPHLLTRRVAGRVIVFCLIAADLLSIPMLRTIDAPWLPTLAVAGDTVHGADGVSVRDDHRGRMRSASMKVFAPHVERAAAAEARPYRHAVHCSSSAASCLPFATQHWWRVTTPPGWNIPESPLRTALDACACSRILTGTTAIVPRQYTRAGVMRRELIQRVVHQRVAATVHLAAMVRVVASAAPEILAAAGKRHDRRRDRGLFCRRSPAASARNRMGDAARQPV